MDDELEKIRQAAYKALDYRWYTTKQLTDKLLKKKFPYYQVEEIIDELVEYEYLNDTRYAELWIEDKKTMYGRKRMAWELRQKGIERDIIEEALAEYYSEEEEEETIRRVAENKRSSYASDAPMKRKQKLGSYLLRRGFPSSLVWHIVRELETGDEDF